MSTSKISSLFLLFVASLGVSACANYATLQEADTVPRGHGKTGLGATYTTYKVEATDGTKTTVSVPAFNIWRRQGLTDQLEVHGSVWIPLGASLGLKYQLLGNRNQTGLAVSVGADVGALQVSADDANGNTVKSTLIDTYVPLYVGLRFSPGFAAYVSPKYIFRYATSSAGTGTDNLAGGTVGLAIGEGTSLLLEGTVIYDLSLKEPAIQGGVGFAF